MDEMITIIDENTGEPIADRASALTQFSYQDGYLLSVTGLGKHGVKVELRHQADAAAIILPPEEARQCATWLLNTIDLKNHNSLGELHAILQRLIKHKQSKRILEHGDKRKIKDAIKLLKHKPSKN
jgi:hypothetical protein